MRSPARLLRLVTCALLLAAPALAAPVRPLFTLDVTREPWPDELDLAANASGDLLVAWRAIHEDGTRGQVRARLYDSDGRPKSGVIDVGGRGGSRVQVVPALEGAFWVVFATADNAIVARRVTRHGTVERPILLLPRARALLALRAEGNPAYGGLVVWTHTFDDVNHSTVRAFDREGRPLGPARQDIGGDPRNELAVAPDGRALLIAEGIGSDGMGSHLYGLFGQLFDRNGAQVGALELTPPVAEGYWGGSYDVTSTGSSDFLVTWLEWDDEGQATKVQEVTAAGELGGVLDAGHRPSGGPTTPTPDGGFVLAWDGADEVIANRFVAAQRHAKNGAPTSDPVLVDDGRHGGHLGLSVAASLDATNYAAWWWRAGRSYVLHVVAWRFDRQ